ncbi:hypothetical protein DRN85_02800 [Methanosarcinales archaeon]|nr:MAG: hypothetical protein DRN85_02800 [Methanosarcinales archaeon]
MNLKLILVLILMVALVLSTPLFQRDDASYIEFTSASIRFNGTDATITIHYDLAPTVKAYIFAFGTGSIESNIENISSSFEDYKIVRIKPEYAEILVKNASIESKGYYLHHEIELPTRFRVLEVYTPEKSSPRNYYNMNTTPNIFYQSAQP